ncbi:carbohydrate sulfotransferase 11 isoform X2 [Procambarus clarkii]|uniref:carbohydrate sulfotransferase 11 isoform X2 n=1 Tax=Procambarus clarkii TaxID=6728 RepID=UPI0037437E68
MCSLQQGCVLLPSRRAARKVTVGLVSCLTVMVVVQLASVQVHHHLHLNLPTVSQWVRGLANQSSAARVGNVSDGHVNSSTHWVSYPEAAGIVDDSGEREDIAATWIPGDGLVPQREDVKFPKQYQHDQVRKLSSNWTEATTARVRGVLEGRRRRVREVCRSLHGLLNPVLDRVYTNLLFVAKYRMVWCPVFKAASTTWVKNLLLLAGEQRVSSGLHQRARQIYTQPEDPAAREDLLKTSLKMMIVRHPLERLLSAYRRSKGMKNINMHWRPYWLTCAPCHLTYDVISQVETLDQDQEYVIRELGLQDKLFNLHSHSSNFDVFNGTSAATRHYYSTVPLALLQELVQYYKYDFDLFGYSPEAYYKMALQPDQANLL